MTTFDDRERAFENLFVHDAEVRFRALARRNKAMAAWAAAQMGRTGAAAASYQDEILGFGLVHPGDDALVERLAADLASAGHNVPADAVRTEMTRQLARAVADEKPA